MSVVWTSSVDDGAYDVKVVRHGDNGYHGILFVVDSTSSVIIHSQNVTLSRGALFGPEEDDIAAWLEDALDVIDNPEHRVIAIKKRYEVQRDGDNEWHLIGMYEDVKDALIRRGDATTNGVDVREWDNVAGKVIE